jgi:hypothetical protein
MTSGQIEQLQELSKCYMTRRDANIARGLSFEPQLPMNKWEKHWLRRLSHQYRHQIAAMRKNRGKA